MQTRDEEICGSFAVETENHELKQVFVTQKSLSLYSKDERYFKSFRLGSVDGIVVYPTKEPDIFKLSNGATLKKRNRQS